MRGGRKPVSAQANASGASVKPRSGGRSYEGRSRYYEPEEADEAVAAYRANPSGRGLPGRWLWRRPRTWRLPCASSCFAPSSPASSPARPRESTSEAPLMPDLPLLVVALTICAYWLRVGAMVVHARRRQHGDVGVIPEQPAERAMWLVLVPVVVLWCALPWLALAHDRTWLRVPEFARAGVLYPALRYVAALAAVASLALTIRC